MIQHEYLVAVAIGFIFGMSFGCILGLLALFKAKKVNIESKANVERAEKIVIAGRISEEEIVKQLERIATGAIYRQ